MNATISLATKKSDIPVKCINWSYPTSENAKRFRFPKGCWTVSITNWSASGEALETKAIKGFENREDARQFAASLPQKWAGWSAVEDRA